MPIQHILLCLERDGDAGDAARYGRILADTLQARLHVLYLVADPLAADWTAEMDMSALPRVHEGMEAEARERLSRWLPADEQERLNVTLAIGTGSPTDEIQRYVEAERPDLVVLGVGGDRDALAAIAADLVKAGSCSVLVAASRE